MLTRRAECALAVCFRQGISFLILMHSNMHEYYCICFRIYCYTAKHVLSLILLASYFSHIITSCVHMDAMSLCLPAVPSLTSQPLCFPCVMIVLSALISFASTVLMLSGSHILVRITAAHALKSVFMFIEYFFFSENRKCFRCSYPSELLMWWYGGYGATPKRCLKHLNSGHVKE